MTTIPIPIWFLVFLSVGAFFFYLGLLFIIVCVITSLFVRPINYDEDNGCPYEIESEDPDYNPEYIPPNEREG